MLFNKILREYWGNLDKISQSFGKIFGKWFKNKQFWEKFNETLSRIWRTFKKCCVRRNVGKFWEWELAWATVLELILILGQSRLPGPQKMALVWFRQQIRIQGPRTDKSFKDAVLLWVSWSQLASIFLIWIRVIWFNFYFKM